MRKHHVIHESYDDYEFRGIARRQEKMFENIALWGAVLIIPGVAALFLKQYLIGIALIIAGIFIVYMGSTERSRISELRQKRRDGIPLRRNELERVGMGDY